MVLFDSLLPSTNQLANALKSSVLKRLHPRMKNHFMRIRKRSHFELAAASSSSFVGRWGELDVRVCVRCIRRWMNGV